MPKGNSRPTNRSVAKHHQMIPAFIRELRHTAVKQFREGAVYYVYDARKGNVERNIPMFRIKKVNHKYKVIDNFTNEIVFEHASISVAIKHVDARMEHFKPKEQR